MVDKTHSGDDALHIDSDLDELSEIEKDTLSEVSNMSMGAAATTLANLVNRKVTITVPEVATSTLRSVKQLFDLPCVLVDVKYKQGLLGSNFLIATESDGAAIANAMMGEYGEAQQGLDELLLSALSEAMNMMMGSAATAMSTLFSRTIDISPPAIYRTETESDDENLPIDSLDEPLVIMYINLSIEGLLDTKMVQVLEIDFARDVVATLLGSDADDIAATSAVKESPEVPQSDTSEDYADDLLADFESSLDDMDAPDPGDFEFNVEKPSSQQSETSQSGSTSPSADASLQNIKIELIKNIPVQLRAVLGESKMTIQEVLRLGPGHIVELDTLEGEPIDVFANNTLVAKGEVVVVNEQFGIRVTEIATQRDRINSIQ